MAKELIGLALQTEDIAKLDELAAALTNGDRSELVRLSLAALSDQRRDATQQRAATLNSLQEHAHAHNDGPISDEDVVTTVKQFIADKKSRR